MYMYIVIALMNSFYILYSGVHALGRYIPHWSIISVLDLRRLGGGKRRSSRAQRSFAGSSLVPGSGKTQSLFFLLLLLGRKLLCDRILEVKLSLVLNREGGRLFRVDHHRTKVDVVDGRDCEAREDSFGTDSDRYVGYDFTALSDMCVYHLNNSTVKLV